MEFWDWFQIVVAVMIGNAFTASVAFFLLYLHRHENMQKRSESSVPLWVYPMFLVPMGLAIAAVVTLV